MPTGAAERLMPTLRRVVLGRQSAARSDGELVGAFVATNDADSFAELVRRHGPMVLGVCRRVTGDRTTADDAFQATFLVLARRAAAVRPREQVGNFLYGVAYRTALKARTVLARRRARERQVDVMPEPTAPPVAPWDDVKNVIDEELDRLPDKLRLPVVLCDLEGRPQREVARRLNIPPATLATRLASARRTLAQRLTRRGVTLSGGALAGLLGTHASAFAVPSGLAAGVVRAVEVGAPVGSLVSANALHLSEGVLRMMMLAKLKAVAVMAVTALALTTGLGVGLVPAAADEPTPKTVTADKTAPKAAPAVRAAVPLDDLTFLRRLTMDVRGTPPTDVEVLFFVADADGEKRAKVVNWVTDDDAARQALAKKLGVPADRLKLVRGKLSADGTFVELTLDKAAEKLFRATTIADAVSVALAPDGQKIAIEGKAVVNDVTVAVDRVVEGRWAADHNVYIKRLVPAAAADADRIRYVAGEKYVPLDDKSGKADDYRVVTGKWLAAADADKLATGASYEFFVYVDAGDSDAEFLKRVLTDVRGSGPTALETKYFTEDKDAKKREKLLDTLLKDPAVQKKLGESWKAKMLAPQTAAKPVPQQKVVEYRRIYRAPDGTIKEVVEPRTITTVPPVPGVPLPPKPPAPPTPPVVKPLPPQPGVKVTEPPMVVKPLTPAKTIGGTVDVIIARQPDKFDKLVDSLIAAKKDDAAILEAITLAGLGRLPTDVEKKLAAGVGKAADRKAAWVGVARALADADGPTPVKVKLIEAPPLPPKPPAPPVPPAKP